MASNADILKEDPNQWTQEEFARRGYTLDPGQDGADNFWYSNPNTGYRWNTEYGWATNDIPAPAGAAPASSGFDNPGTRPTGADAAPDDPWAGFPSGTSGFGTGTSAMLPGEKYMAGVVQPFVDKTGTLASNINPADLFTPSAGVNIATNAAAGAMNAPQYQGDLYGNVLASGGPTNWSEDVLKWFGQTSPADMSPYYDRAKERSGADINRQFAARGMYGSSAATDALGQAFTDLDAQQAKDEADYGLKRYGLAGTLASGADASDLAGILGLGELASGAGGESLDRFKTAGELGLGVEEADIDRIEAGAGILGDIDRIEADKILGGGEMALGVGGQVLDSEQQTFDQFLTMARDAAGLADDAFTNLNAEEMAIMEAIQNGEIGVAEAAMINAQNLSERFRADIGVFFDAYGKVKGAKAAPGG